MSGKNVEAIYQLSPQQQGMLFESVSSPNSGIHVEQLVRTLEGKLNVSALAQTWKEIVRRHSIMRTGFVWKEQDEPLQVVLRHVDVSIEQHDLRSATDAASELGAYLQANRLRGFDLSKPPLMRLALFQTAETEYQFVWTLHHILMDGWCQPIVDRDFFELYRAFDSNTEPTLEPVRPYRDYITWLRRRDKNEAERFWRATLKGFNTPTPLGKEIFNDADVIDGERYGTHRVLMSAATTAKIRALVRDHRITLSTLIHGVWALLLSRYSGNDDIVFGTTLSGRPADIKGVENMVGLFVNTVPLRITIDPRKLLWTLLEHVQEQHLRLRRFEYCSTGQVHEWGDMPGATPLYESILVFENYPHKSLAEQFARLNFRVKATQSFGAHTGYAISFLIADAPELILRFVYDRRRFAPDSAAAIIRHFIKLLEAIADKSEPNVQWLLAQIPPSEIPKVVTRLRPGMTATLDTEASSLSETERKLVEIWREVLGVEHINRTDNFFEWGGHSLLGTQLISRVRNAFAVELPLRHLFEAPTLAMLAEKIDQIRRLPMSETVPLVRVARDRPLPLSFAQQRLWFLHRLEPENPFYNTPCAIRLGGNLNVAALTLGLNEIAARHEVLRTHFPEVEGQPVQVISPPAAVELSVIDVSSQPEGSRIAEAEKLATQEAKRPFNLAAGAAFRALLVKLGEVDHLLVVNMHHIVSDAWSFGILYRELSVLYQAFSLGKPSPLPPLSVQYADYSVWQAQHLDGSTLDKHVDFWRRQFVGIPDLLEIPMDHPRPARQTYRGRYERFELPPELTRHLKELSKSEAVTLFMTLMAGFEVLLAKLSKRERIVIGTDVANRTPTETENLIGLFVNLVPICTNVSANLKFRELLGHVREVALAAFAHQLPYEKLVEELQPVRTLNRNPLVQILFVMQNVPFENLQLPHVTATPYEIVDETSRFDIAFFVSEAEDKIKGVCVYSSDLFEPLSITRLVNQFQHLLQTIVDNPDQRLANLRVDETEKAADRKVERLQSQLNRLKQVKRKPLGQSLSDTINLSSFGQEGTRVTVITPAVDDIELAQWAKLNKKFVEERVLRDGAVLFRGFDVNSSAEFERFALALCPELFGDYGDLPREQFEGNVYGSTPYPAASTILFHNESSHMHRWPMKIWFLCVTPALHGGETPLVDCRTIYKLLDPAIRRRMQEKKLMYVRNYTSGLDVSWQSFFGTSDREAVEDYCRRAGVGLEWKNGNGLQTRQICPAIVTHPETGETTFFNQIQLHHVGCLEPAVRQALLSTLKAEDLPRNVYYGDGSPIEDSVVAEIYELYRSNCTSFAWQRKDVLMLNNMLVAHSRNPYVGERKIVVAMGEMVEQSAVA